MAMLVASAGLATAQEVYRWVDENGEVHYNTTLPPEYANRPHQILRNGVVIKTIDDPTAPPLTKEEEVAAKNKENPEEVERQKQMRADRLLVLKYRSEEEIIDAMNVEIENLAYDARLIEQSRISVMASLSGQIREAADRQRSGLPEDAEIRTSIAQLQARMAQGRRNQESLDLREKQIRDLFNSELARYRFLVNGGAPGEPIPDTSTENSGS